MEQRWNLDDLYPSFESESFQRDFSRFDTEIEKIRTWAATELNPEADPVQIIKTYIASQTEIGHLSQRLGAYASLRLSVEVTNAEALAYVEKLQKKTTGLTEPTVTFSKWLAALPDLKAVAAHSEIIQTHIFMLTEKVRLAAHLLSDREEVLLSEMKNTASRAWTKLQNLITSTLSIEVTVDGEQKTLPLAAVRNLYGSPDGAARRAAYDAELETLPRLEMASAASLNAIKGEVITVSKMRGYESPLEMTLEESRMDRESLHAMLVAVEEALPNLRRYYRRKAKILGHKDGLPFYDIFAPLGDGSMRFSYPEARTFIVDNFRTFSDKLADYADYAFEHRWIDAEPRNGKRGGAFCSNLHCIGQSRILANFDGSFDNVRTLAHELGHGYHGSCLKDESLLNARYPMPLAETASILCETIVSNAALESASRDDALAIVETELSSAGQVIVDIFSRYLFETELFQRRGDASLSVDELKGCMTDAQKKAYGDGLDHNYLHPYLWLVKPHYYNAELNFYNFPYTFGLLFAKGLYAQYRLDRAAFVKRYDELLRSTGKNLVADVTLDAGIDIHNPTFWRDALGVISESVEQFLALTD